jgi:pimeloyl-ACP methyl ester carboxylesterase
MFYGFTLWQIKNVAMKQDSTLTFIKKGGKLMLTILSVLLLCIVVCMVTLFILSPGKPEPFYDKNGSILDGSISEIAFINVHGNKQGMFIKSKNRENPVLLILHGGMPVYFLSHKYPTGLEDIFTVVWYEQRGFGLSFSPGIPADSITLNQIKSDTEDVTNYLRKRFGKDKIFLMGHSGGTFIGMHMVSQTPELYYAYIGIAQMSNQLKSEQSAYEYMLKKYTEAGNKKMVKKLEESPVIDKVPGAYLTLRDKAMHNLGIGTTRNMNSIISGIFIPSLTCCDYTFTEKINLWRAKAQSGVHPLWNTILSVDLANEVPEVVIPVYFFHGIYDYTVSYNLAYEYFESIKAPLKRFYTFHHSAHSPIFEEPERMKQILSDIILETGGENTH